MNERRRLAQQLRDQGMSYGDIGQRIGVSMTRAREIVADAHREATLLQVFGGVSTRAAETLRRAGLTLSDTRAMSDDDLLNVRNVGVMILEEVRAAAAADPLLTHLDRMSVARLGG